MGTCAGAARVARPLAAVVLVGMMAALLAVPGRAAPKPGRFTIRKVHLAPKSVSGNGGTVRLKVQVNGPAVRSVQAQAQVTGGGAGTAASLRRTGRGIYAGTTEVTPNPQPRAGRAAIVVTVTGTSGQVAQRVIGFVKVGPADDSLPPPPPP